MLRKPCFYKCLRLLREFESQTMYPRFRFRNARVQSHQRGCKEVVATPKFGARRQKTFVMQPVFLQKDVAESCEARKVTASFKRLEGRKHSMWIIEPSEIQSLTLCLVMPWPVTSETHRLCFD